MVRETFYRNALSVLCLVGMGAGVWAAPGVPVSVSVQPGAPLIEQGKGQQLLSLDFKIDNQSADKIELSGIEVSVLGSADKLIAQYRVGPTA